MTGRDDPDNVATPTGDSEVPDTPRDEQSVVTADVGQHDATTEPPYQSVYLSMRERVLALPAFARDHALLRVRPGPFAVVCLALTLVAPAIAAGQVLVSFPTIAGGVVLAGIYWLWRPSEYQLRHRLSENVLVVPLKESGSNHGEPAGSERAVEFETDRSVLVLGETGSGKTEAIKLLAHQMQADPDEAFVIFDYKEDYQTFFDDDDVIRVSSRDSDVTWNVFRELEEPEDCDEIAEAIFAGAEDDYFTRTAIQVFADILRLVYQRGFRNDYLPTNYDLLKFLNDTDARGLHVLLADEGLSATKHLPEDVEATANIVSMIEERVHKVFTGDFAKDGDFSIREYMADPQGKKLILDFPVERSSSVQPVFRLFIDWSIRFGLTTERGSYYVLDEFAALPELDMLERLINAGRAYNCYAILGVQAIPQLHERYGEDEADSLLSGMAQEIHFRVGDQTSVEYWRQRIGRKRVVRGEDDDKRVTEEYAIGEDTIQNLKAGKGIVHTTEGWQRGRLYMLEDVEHRLLPREMRDER